MPDSIATLSKENDISIIKLDDGKANAFSYDMLSQVNDLLTKVPRDSGALVITGREGLFSGGFDLKTLATGDMEKITKMVQSGYRLLLELFSFDRPIVAAVSGHSIALGLFVTCSADYRIAIDGKYVCQANEVRNNMDIPTQIMEIIRARVNKNIFTQLFIIQMLIQFKTPLKSVILMRLFLRINLCKGSWKRQKS